MAKESSSGLGVNSRYGPVIIPDEAVGSIKTEGFKNQLTCYVSHVGLADPGTYLNQVYTIPAGSIIVDIDVFVTEAFSAFPNVDNIVNIGTDGSAATNGIAVQDAVWISTGHYNMADATIAQNNTWGASAILAADTDVSFELSGTSATTYAPTAGEATVVITYYHAANPS
jgi:hypothetical protein